MRARQAAVAELTPRLDLREDLALLGADVPAGVELARLAEWGEAPPILADARSCASSPWLLAGLGVGAVAWL